MSLDHSFIGASGIPVTQSWDERDAMLYALAVGASHGDASRELEFTTETSGRPQRVLPSFVWVAAVPPLPEGFEPDTTKVLNGGMGFEMFTELPPRGTVTSVQTVDSIYDKGSGALINSTIEVRDTESGELVAILSQEAFLRDGGGFGGDRGPKDDWALPDREPEATVVYETLPEQALLYRLTGDRNPLHSSPEFARLSGFEKPIMHGACTYGFAARALLHAVADGDPARFRSMYGRFTKPMALGDTLTVQVWKTDAGALFRTLDGSGDVVIDRGRMSLR
jgi:acyl dehydratase